MKSTPIQSAVSRLLNRLDPLRRPASRTPANESAAQQPRVATDSGPSFADRCLPPLAEQPPAAAILSTLGMPMSARRTGNQLPARGLPPPVESALWTPLAPLPRDFLHDYEGQRTASVQLVFGHGAAPLVVDVLRAPFTRASNMVTRALRHDWEEALKNSIHFRLDGVPASAWMKIIRLVAGKADVKACKPTVDEAVAMFAAIDFLDPKSETEEGAALKALAEECKWPVRFAPTDRSEAVLAAAIAFGYEAPLLTFSHEKELASSEVQRLEQVRLRLAVEANGGRLISPSALGSEDGDGSDAMDDVTSQADALRSYPWARVTFGAGELPAQFVGSGYAMACASEVWSAALPDITLDTNVPADVWNKILCAVHEVGEPSSWGPRADDAASMLLALSGLKPNVDDPAGRALLSLAQQCETLLSARVFVDELRAAMASNDEEGIAQAAQKIGAADRMVVAYLDAALVRTLFASNPWSAGEVSTYALLIDWAVYHGPGPREMPAFLREQGLESVVDWSCCSAELLDEAIAVGVAPTRQDLVPDSLRHIFTRQTGDKYISIHSVEAGELIAHHGEVTRLDLRNGTKRASYRLPDGRGSRGNEYPTHGGVVGHRMLASVNQNCFMTSNPTLWDLDTGAFVTRLNQTQDCKPPTTRAQAYRYIVSGCEEGSGMSRLRVGVWGTPGFGREYTFLQNFQPKFGHCDNIVGHGKSVFTSGMSKDTYYIEERNLETNRLTRTWAVPERKSSRAKLLVTHDHIVLWGSEALVYRRSASHDKPEWRFDSENTYHASVVGPYVAAVSGDTIGVWDLRTGDKVQSTHRASSGEWKDQWSGIGFDGKTIAVSDRRGRLNYFQAAVYGTDA